MTEFGTLPSFCRDVFNDNFLPKGDAQCSLDWPRTGAAIGLAAD